MNCAHCTLAIEPEAKKMQMPCCDLTYHSQCGIEQLFSGGFYNSIQCLCGTHLHDSPYYSSHFSSQQENIEQGSIEQGNALLEGTAKPDMKTLKEKSRELSAARKEFEKHLREELVAFQEVALPQLEAIKALKDTRMSAVTQSPQYKEFNKKKISFSLMLGKFQKKYPTIPTYCIRRKFGSNYYSHRYSTPFFMLKRKFRLRKWY